MKNSGSANSGMTIGDWLQYAEQRLAEARVYLGHGTDNYWDEALHLSLPLLGLSFDAGREVLKHPLRANDKIALEALLAQRIEQRIPVPYLTHTAWFAHMPFTVNRQVLIPRSPIAELIESGFQPWFLRDGVMDVPTTILDLCCGGGCIGLACAEYLPECRVDLADLSVDALAVARENLQHYAVQQPGLMQRVRIYQGDLFGPIPPSQSYDLVVSNPPYVDALDMANLPPEFLHEPRLALAAGQDGLDLVKRILAQAAAYLNTGGMLIVEVGNSQEALEEQYPEVPFTWLEFERGGFGVFLLYKEQLEEYFPV